MSERFFPDVAWAAKLGAISPTLRWYSLSLLAFFDALEAAFPPEFFVALEADVFTVAVFFAVAEVDFAPAFAAVFTTDFSTDFAADFTVDFAAFTVEVFEAAFLLDFLAIWNP